MALILELTPEQERRLAGAREKGIPVESLLLDFIDTVLDTTEQAEADEEADFSAWLKGELPPMTGTEAVAYWQKHGLLGGYSNEDIDSLELARRLREQAQTRPHILAQLEAAHRDRKAQNH